MAYRYNISGIGKMRKAKLFRCVISYFEWLKKTVLDIRISFL